MLIDTDQLIKDVVDACAALAAHFHGNGGINVELKTPDERDGKNGSCTIKKYDKVLYSAEADCPHCIAQRLLIQIVKTERVQKLGPRHKNCPICNYIFRTSSEKLKMFEIAHSLVGKVEEALEHMGMSTQESAGVPPEKLN